VQPVMVGDYDAKITRCHSARYDGYIIMSGMAPIKCRGKTFNEALLSLHVSVFGQEIGQQKMREL